MPTTRLHELRMNQITLSLAPETTTYLEMRQPDQLCRGGSSELAVERLSRDSWETGRRLYCDVGGPWKWIDRLIWSDHHWKQYYEHPGVELWVGRVQDRIAGYFELVHADGETELAYFGLCPDFIGRGLGSALLTAAVERAWAAGAKRVWVHTSDRDHPAALSNYLARGFRIYKTERAMTPTTGADGTA